MNYYGDFLENETIYLIFNTFDADGASCTITDLATTDIHVHKDGSTTQRSSSSGFTLAIDFDGITGNHLITIDTSDNTDAGFFATGSDYQVRIEGVTVATQTLNSWVGSFSIENRNIKSDAATPSQVKDEIVDALNVDTYTEPGKENPAVSASIVTKLGYLYKTWRNQKEQDGDYTSIYNDAGTVIDQKAATKVTSGVLTVDKMQIGS